MALPSQLQKQVDDAKTFYEQRNAPESSEAPAESQQESAQPEAVAETPSPAEEVATPAKEAATQQADDENSATYAQRWRSLQGVYSATKRQLDDTQSRIANLEQLLSQMNSAKETAASQPVTLVTDKDVNDYGSDMIEFARRVTREEVAPLAQAVKMLMGKLDQLQGVVPVVQNVAQAQAKSAHDRFYEALTARVPDWQVVNDNPRFHDWLLSPDPLSGLQRQTLLTDAHNALDIARVVNIFEMGRQALGIAVAPTPQRAEQQRASNVTKLEKQIAPGRASASTAPPTQTEKKQWTRQEIAKFFADKQRGVYRGREADAQALERDIFLAQREGRVALNAA